MTKIEVEKLSSMTGHKDCIYTLEHSNKENIFFSGAGDGMVVQWNLAKPNEGELVAKVPNSIYALKYLKGHNALLLGQNFEGIHLIDLNTQKELLSSKITDSYIFDIQVQDKNIFVATGDGQLVVLDISDLSTLYKFKLADKSIRCIAIDESRQVLALGLSDNSIRIFSWIKNQVINTIIGHQNSIFTLAFSPDGKYLLSGSRDAHLKVWECEQNFSLKKSIVAHMFAINHIEYSPEAELFATCSMDKSIKIWDAQNFELVKVIDKARHAGHGTSVNKLMWTNYKNQLVSCSDDRSISVWNITHNNNQ